MFWVYALYNKKHNRIYIGQTRDLNERLKLHRSGIFSSSFTKRFDGEWSLIFTEKCKNRKEALLREKQLKSYQGRQFVKKQIPL